MERLIVTLDGPAGSGKSTVARQLAEVLGVEFLDTGAMYRGLTAVCFDRGVNPSEQPGEAAAIARQVTMKFDWQGQPPRLLIDDVDVTPRLRDADVTDAVSDLSAISDVRKVMVEAQRRIGREHPRLVTEGRDQGSVVFPDAEVKFFMEAQPQVRARRRANQLRQAGRDADEVAILANIVARDRKDSTRRDGPLICPEDAYMLDTSDMALDEVVEHLAKLVRERVSDGASLNK